MLYSPRDNPMSSLLAEMLSLSVSSVLHLIGIFAAALLINRILRIATNSMVVPASSQTRTAQAREQQTRSLADTLYRVASKIVWILALLTALPEFGINILAAVIVLAVFGLAVAVSAQHLIRDAIAGFYIILEDQYAAGDTIQVAETIGRVENLTLRRTIVRDARGALVTISNGDIRTISNFNRDWSQAFVDVSVSPEVSQERVIQALDSAASALRNDSSWSPALVDGPRILGLQSYDQSASTIRLQVRTAPFRHEDVARELRRRIQLEFQRLGLPLSNVQRVELVGAPIIPSTEPPVPSA